MGYTYVLKCSDNSYYIGSTSDIVNRLDRHKRGTVKYTKGRLPKEAYTFEMRIKSWKKRKSIERMLDKGDNIANKYLGVV